MGNDNDPGTEPRLQSEITGNGTLSTRLVLRYHLVAKMDALPVYGLTRVRVELLAGIRNDSTSACLAMLIIGKF